MRVATIQLALAAGALAGIVTINESYVPMTTSTVYATSTFTVTHCGALSSCQVPTTTVVTLTTAVSTTICPVSDVETSGSGFLSLSLALPSSNALTVDASLGVSAPADSQTAILPLSILTISAGASVPGMSIGASLLSSQPAGYSVLSVPSSAPQLGSQSAAASQLTLLTSTTAVGGAPTTTELTFGLSVSLMASVPAFSIPAYGVPPIASGSVPTGLISNLVSAIASAVTSPAVGPLLSHGVSVIESVVSSPAAVATLSLGVSSVGSAITSPAVGATLSLSVSGAVPTMSIPPISGLSPPGYVMPSKVHSSLDSTATRTLYISRPLNATLPATGTSTLTVSAPAHASNASNATSAYATPSIFLGAANTVSVAPAAMIIALLSCAAYLFG